MTQNHAFGDTDILKHNQGAVTITDTGAPGWGGDGLSRPRITGVIETGCG